MQVAYTDHYAICIKSNFGKFYIVWLSTDAADGVLIDSTSKMIAFESLDDLNVYMQGQNIKLKGDVTVYNICPLQQWLVNPKSAFDYDLFLNIWNLSKDVAESTRLNVSDEITNTIYNKLFNASDVFIANGLNPIFSATETETLRQVMQNGLDLLLGNIIIINPSLKDI